MEGGGIYQVIILIVGFVAIIKGYRKGFTGQICGLLGVAFGVVATVVLGEEVAEALKKLVPSLTDYPFPPFVYSILASTIIYFSVYLLFRFFTSVIQSALSIFHIGMLNKIAGAAFCLFKYMLPLSIIYNILLCISPDSPLIEYSRADDGNLVEGVLLLAPAVMDCVSVDDLNHALQLLDAKKISNNFNPPCSVIELEPGKEKFKKNA